MADAPEPAPRTEEIQLAGVSERLLAFLLDFFAVLLPMGALGVWLGPNAPDSTLEVFYGLSVIAAFFAYHGVLNARPGQTLGKWVAGIKVVRLAGEKAEGLGLGRSFLRSFGYLASFLPLGLGLLWSRANDYRRCWHDYLAGTCVVRVREKGRAARLATAAAAWGLLLALVLGAGYRIAVRGPLSDLEMVDAAQKALGVIAALEEKHKAATGRYTDDVAAVVDQAEMPVQLNQAMPKVLLEESLQIELTPAGYRITAKARDPRHTPVELAGPPK